MTRKEQMGILKKLRDRTYTIAPHAYSPPTVMVTWYDLER